MTDVNVISGMLLLSKWWAKLTQTKRRYEILRVSIA